MIPKLWRGQYGLAATWWLFGVLGGMLVNVVSIATTIALTFALGVVVPPLAIDAGSIAVGSAFMTWGLAVMVVLWLNVGYAVVVSVGVGRAAGAYSGSRAWAWLATLAVAVYWLWLVTTLASMFIGFRGALAS